MNKRQIKKELKKQIAKKVIINNIVVYDNIIGEIATCRTRRIAKIEYKRRICSYLPI